MAAEIQVNVNLKGEQAKATVDSIEKAYQHLKKELEKPAKVKFEESALQKQINALTGVSRGAKSAAQSYQAMAKIEIDSVQKITAAQQKLAIQQKRLENKAMVDQMKRQAKEADEYAKSVAKIQAEYDKLSNAKAKAEAKDRSASSKEAFKGYLERAKAAEKAAAAEEKLAAAQRRMGESWGTVNTAQATNIASMTQYIRAQEGMENATVRATGAIRNSVGTFQTYSVSTNVAGQATQNYRVAVNTTTGEVYALDKGVKTATVSMGNMGKAALSFVKQIVGFYGAAQSIRYALKEMKSMSDEMIVYQKVTKATDQQMEQIRKQSYATAKAYGQTPTDFLSAAQEMARAGYGEQASAMADLAVKTKLVGDITAEEASKFLLAVDAGYKYGGSIEQLSAVLDSANEIGNNYATSIGKISEGMTLVASLAGQVNVPINELIAALGTMTAVTQRSGSEMARALRSVFLNVLGDTETEIEEGVTVAQENIDSMTQALMQYGDEATKAALAAGELINPMEAIGALAKAYKEGRILPKDLFDISKNIAGQRYYNAFAALIQNYDGMYKEMLQTANNAAGSADKEIDVLTKSWTTKFNRLKTQWVEMVNASLSEGLIKDLIEGSTAALEFAGSLENLAGAALGAYAAFKSLKAGLAGMKEAGGSISGFGAGNWFGIGAGVLIAGISAAKSAYEKSMRDAQSAAEKAVSSAIEKTSGAKDMASILARYKKIASDGIDKEKGELGELKTLQSELNSLVGDQGTAIDIVNGKYGETLKKLKEMTEEQRQAALMTLQTAKSQAVANWKQQDLNGTFRSGLNTGVPMEYNKAIEEYLKNSKYFRVFEGADGFPMLFMNKKPEDAEGILEFYKEIEDFYNWLGSHTSTGEEAAKGMKSMGEEYSSMYVKLASFVSLVKTAAGPVKEAQDAIDNFNKAMSEEGSTSSTGSGNAGDNNKKVEKSYMTLADAIEEATKAKEKFDDAMKKTKADEANAYTKAFKTYKDELKKGRVNSTAFYAAARMLLGDDAYNRTNGSSSAVRKAMQKRGGSGSIQQAWNILSASYKNKKGVEMEGYGIYQLLSQTKGVKGLSSKTLVDKNGNIRIPKLSDQQWNQISKQWGGISKAALLNYFNSFDQYNKKGKATDDKVKTAKKKQETDQQKNTKSINSATKAVEDATAAVNDLAGKLGQDENPGEGEGDKGGEGAGETPPPGGTPEEPKTPEQIGVEAIATVISYVNGEGVTPDQLVAALNAYIGVYGNADGVDPNVLVSLLNGIISSYANGENVDPNVLVAALNAFVKAYANGEGVDPNNLVSVLNAIINTYTNGEGVDPNALVGGLSALVAAYANGDDVDPNLLVRGLSAVVSAYANGENIDPNALVSTLQAVVTLYSNGVNVDPNSLVSLLSAVVTNYTNGVLVDPNILVASLNAVVAAYQNGENIDPNVLTSTLLACVQKYTNGENVDPNVLTSALMAYVLAYKNGEGADPNVLTSALLAIVQAYKNGSDVDPSVLTSALLAVVEAYKSGDGVDPNTLTSALNAIISIYSNGPTADPNALVASLQAIVLGYTNGEGVDPNTLTSALNAIVTAYMNGEGVDPNALVDLLSAYVSSYQNSGATDPNGLVASLAAIIVSYKNGEGVDPNALVAVLSAIIEATVGGDSTTNFTNWLNALPKIKQFSATVTEGSTTAYTSWLNSLPSKKHVEVVISESGQHHTGRGREPGEYATGTDNFRGGAALVNDGAGPELIVNRGRAFIAGGGKPTVVNLDKGAKIFTATETRNILNNGGMPSFAGGTGEYSANVKPGDYKADSGKKKKSSSSKSKKKSKDKDNDSFSKLQTMVDYIINRIGTAVSEQIKVIDEQIANLQKERELQKQQNELAEKQKAVADAQKDLQDAMKERTVRYLGEDGKWHWQADARKVQSAQEALDKAKKDLKEYKEEQAFNKKVEKLENKKTNLQNNYDTLSKQWSDIVNGVNTPTGTINALLNDVMKNGTKQEKEGAKAIKNTLLNNAKSGKFKSNYSEALRSIAAATAGNPVMPGDTSTTLASLIAGAGGEKISSSLASVLSTATAKSKKTSSSSKLVTDTQNTITNYYVNGAKIGADVANTKTLSSVLEELKVYAGS